MQMEEVYMHLGSCMEGIVHVKATLYLHRGQVHGIGSGVHYLGEVHMLGTILYKH